MNTIYRCLPAAGLMLMSLASNAQSPFAIHYHLDSFYSISSIGAHSIQIGTAHYVFYNVQRQPSLDTTTSIIAKIDGDGKVVFAKRVHHERANTLNVLRTADNHLLLYHSRTQAGSSTPTPYITKLDTALAVVWSISGISAGLGLAERSGDYVAYGGTNTGTAAGGSLRVVRLNKTTGAVLGQASTLLPGAGGAPDMAHPLSNGNHLLTGLTNGTGSGNAHSFIASVQPSGTAAWATSLENVIGQNYEFSAAAEDGAGNVYVAGRYEAGSGSTTTTGVLVKLSPTGSMIFARHFTLPPATGTTHNTAFYTMSLGGGVLKIFGRVQSFNGADGFYRLVQLRLDTTGAVLGQKMLAVNRAPFSTQNLFGGTQSPWSETADGRLRFAVTSFRECVSNQQNILLPQTDAGGTSTGCDSTMDSATLIDSALTAATPVPLASLGAGSSTQTSGAGLTNFGALDRPLTRTRYCDCSRMADTVATGIVTVGAGDEEAPLVLHPNPSFGSIRVGGVDARRPVMLDVFDITGRNVWSRARYSGEEVALPATLTSGLYLVRINFKEGRQTEVPRLMLL